MLDSKSDSTKGFGHRAWRVFHSVAVATIYLISFVGLHGLTAGLQIFPEIGPWNLSAGLSLWLLDISFGYLPVVLAAHVISLIWPANALTGWQMMMMASIVTGVYALWSIIMRKHSAQPRIDLLDRRSLFSFIITAPAIAMMLSILVTTVLNFTGHVADSGVRSAVLAGFVGNTIGMVLVTPFFLWSGNALTEALLDAMGGDAVVRSRTEAVPPIPSPMSAIPLAIFGALLYFFLGSTITDRLFVLFCLISAPLICMALKYGLNGAASVLLMLGVVAAVSAQTGQHAQDPIWIQMVVIVSSLNTMLIGSLVSQGHYHEGTTKRHAALLNSVSFATEQLLAMTDQDKNVNEVLRHLATESGVTRIYVVENRQNTNGSIAYEHWSEDAAVDQHYLQLLNVVRSKHIRDRADSLAKGEALQYRAADLPEDEHAIMSALNIRVSIILPIFAGGQWWGCLGLDQCSTGRMWSDAEVNAFKAASRALGNLLAHTNVEQQFRQFTGNIPAVFWIASPDGLQRTYVSPAYEQIWGRACESVYEDPESWITAIYYEDTARVRAAIAGQVSGKFDEEYRIVQPDWSVRWIRDTAFPVRDASGQVCRIVGIAQDITPQKEAEERVKTTSLLLSTLIDNLPVGIVVEDQSRRVMHVNQAFCKMFDVEAPRESLVGVDSRLVYAQQQPYAKRIDQIIRERKPCRGEEIVSKDDRIFSCDYIPLLVDGNYHYHLWQYDDITERRLYEERIHTSLKEKEVLLKEIHHRVKNNLQVISSLLYLQGSQIRDYQTAQVFKDSQSRVKAMALVHERLYRSSDLARIDFAGYVQDVTHHLLRSYESSQRNIRLKIEVDPVSLNIDTAIPCALIVNELVSNSLKYAFPNALDGEIRIRLTQRDDENLNLVISDNGIGFPHDFSMERTDSLGLQLVHNLTSQLNGTVRCRNNDGAEIDIRFKPVVNESRNSCERVSHG
jgi:PAS domain S-box-containing protein